MTSRRIWVVVGSLTLATAACGGSGDSKAPTTSAPAPVTTEASPETTQAAPTTEAAPETTEAAPTTESAPSSTEPSSPTGVASYTDVQPAVVQIIATGTFRDPEIGFNTGAGSGSGFIISPDGYAITNNHVVTGAATLEVYIGGELDDSFNAQIVGVSECNDLALIKIDEDDLPYLEMATETPTVGEEIYVAGFPLGDPEYTLVRGIIAKADADGETPWSSVDNVIQHDAEAQPGNSGGPLVNDAGQVVGVHYASGDFGTGTTQKYAISSETLDEVLPKLYEGDFEALGINGSAVWDEAAGISGIWVAAVDAGSPASDVGLKPGDIITSLNGIPLGTEGTMEEYCDVIRTAGEGQPMAIQVLSWDDQAVYEGEINNPDRPLTAVATFGASAEDTGETYTYSTVFDDTGELYVDLPNTWSYDGQPDGAKASIWASPDFDSFQNSWDTPGTKITVFPAPPADTHTIQEIYDLLSATTFLANCTYVGPKDYDDGRFQGILGEWTDCGGTSTGYVMLVTVEPVSNRLVTMEFQYVTSADIDAATTAITTFNVV